jgi:hypothetical protein
VHVGGDTRFCRFELFDGGVTRGDGFLRGKGGLEGGWRGGGSAGGKPFCRRGGFGLSFEGGHFDPKEIE